MAKPIQYRKRIDSLAYSRLFFVTVCIQCLLLTSCVFGGDGENSEGSAVGGSANLKISLLNINQNDTVSMGTDLLSGYKSTDFEILQRISEVDLSKRIQLPKGYLPTNKLSETSRNTTLHVVRLNDKAIYYKRHILTSGIKPDFDCFTHLEFSVKKDPGYLPPNGREFLHRYIVEINVGKEPVNRKFVLKFRTKTWNDFQGSTGEWAAELVNHPVNKLVFKISFPNNKGFSDFTLQSHPKSSTPEKFDLPPQIKIKKPSSITWTIPNPKFHYVYRINWAW